ncbi:MAG: NapC/NirT family cytochrome c, partial [Pseudolabrys sp.]
MPSSRWLFLCSLFVAGGLIGAGVIVVSTEINRRTSTDAFCTSCHSMAVMAADQCPLLGVKRTLRFEAAMSAFDPKRTLNLIDVRSRLFPIS